MKAVDEDEFEVKYIKYFVLTMAAAAVCMVTYFVLTDDGPKYTEVTKETKISNRIENLRVGRGTVYLDFDNRTKYRISLLTRNYAYRQADIRSFVTSSDWVEKKEGSDTVKIMREGKVRGAEYFVFVLGVELNKDLDHGDSF